MNFKQNIILLFSALLFLVSCEEIGPEIRLKDPEINIELIDTTYLVSTLPNPQLKNVLIEDFTGVRCVNCPKGHEQIELLQGEYPGRIVPVAMHSNFLADPYHDDQDLRSDAAQSLDQRLGPSIAKPTGAINRVELAGEMLLFINQWAQACENEINKSSPLNIELSNQADNTDEVFVKVKLIFLENVEEALSISVFLLESDIEVTQLTPDGEVEDYIHNHVLRKTLTPFNGQNLGQDVFEPGRVLEKEFELKEFDPVWNQENFEIVAFVHQAGGDLVVYQSAVIEL